MLTTAGSIMIRWVAEICQQVAGHSVRRASVPSPRLHQSGCRVMSIMAWR